MMSYLQLLLIIVALLPTPICAAGEMGQNISPISGMAYESALNSLLQMGLNNKKPHHYHLQLRFLPFSGAEYQIELACGPNLEGKVGIATLSQPLKTYLQEHTSSSQQTLTSLESAVKVNRKRLSLPCTVVQIDLQEFWDAVAQSTPFISKRAFSDAATNEVTLPLDPFTYDIVYFDTFYSFRMTLAGPDPSSSSIKQSLPVVQWAAQIRRKFAP